MGARTDAARAEVLAARADLTGEADRVEAAARAAVDIPAKVRRNPGRTTAIGAAAGFIVLGGPGRVFRRARNAVLGPPEPLPPSLLPDEIDKALKKIGPDGERVRGVIEREFAQYLEEKAPQRRERDLNALAAVALANVVKPVTQRAGRQLVERLFAPDAPGMRDQLERIRGRRAADEGEAAAQDEPGGKA